MSRKSSDEQQQDENNEDDNDDTDDDNDDNDDDDDDDDEETNPAGPATSPRPARSSSPSCPPPPLRFERALVLEPAIESRATGWRCTPPLCPPRKSGPHTRAGHPGAWAIARWGSRALQASTRATSLHKGPDQGATANPAASPAGRSTFDVTPLRQPLTFPTGDASVRVEHPAGPVRAGESW